VACDVRDAAQVDAVVAETMREFGRIDLLVNNAGYRIRAPLADLPRDEWDAMIGTNLTGVFLCCQAVGRVMRRQGADKIVNITSVAGRTGSRGTAAYAAAQAGVTTLTQSLGAEWAKHGPTQTEGVIEVWKSPAMIAQAAREVPLQRLGRPEEVAWAVVFLASDRADFIIGETPYVSGGPRVSNRETDRRSARPRQPRPSIATSRRNGRPAPSARASAGRSSSGLATRSPATPMPRARSTKPRSGPTRSMFG
jgi:3-oxoacyl-[acyl-carrier protein] reductase